MAGNNENVFGPEFKKRENVLEKEKLYTFKAKWKPKKTPELEHFLANYVQQMNHYDNKDN